MTEQSKTCDELQPGDHLFIDCQGYSHHGIYVAAGKIIHFDSTIARKMLARLNEGPPRIVETDFDSFSSGRAVYVRQYPSGLLTPQETIAKASSRLGEFGYNLFDNNCEHFAVWCKTGSALSTQVNSARRIARTGAAALAVSTAMFRSARVLPLPYRVAAYTAGTVLAVGSTACRIWSEKKRNRQEMVS